MDNLPPLGAAFYTANRDSANPSAESRPHTTQHEFVRPSQRPPSRPQTSSRRSGGLKIQFYRHRADAEAQNERTRRELEEERRAAKAARKEERARLRELHAAQSQPKTESEEEQYVVKTWVREREREREQGANDIAAPVPGRPSRFTNPEPVYAKEVTQQPSRAAVAEQAAAQNHQRPSDVKDLHGQGKTSRPSQSPVANMSSHRPVPTTSSSGPVTKHMRIADTKGHQRDKAGRDRLPRGTDPASDKEVARDAYREKEFAVLGSHIGEVRSPNQTNSGALHASSWAHDYYAQGDPYEEEELEWEAREQEAMAEMSSMVADNQYHGEGRELSGRGEHDEVEEQREHMALLEQEMREMEIGSSAEQRRIYKGVRRGGAGAGAVFYGSPPAGYATMLDYARKDTFDDNDYVGTAKDKDEDEVINNLDERFGPRLADNVIEGLWVEHDDPPPPYEALRHDDCPRSGYTPSKSAYMDDAFR